MPMINSYPYKDVTWIDLENPTRDEVRSLVEKYGIHPFAAEELLLPTSRPRVDRYDDFIYVILHFPALKHSHKSTVQEVDFIIGKNYIITARYDTIDPLHKFAKMLEVNSVLSHNSLIGEHAGYMFYYMMREIYHSLRDELDMIQENLGEIQKRIFTGEEREMVVEISNTSRQLLAFKHATNLHEEVLNSFTSAAKDFFGAGFIKYLDEIKGEYTKVDKSISILSESLSEMRETNDSLLNGKQNQIIGTLTVITFITSVIGIIVGMFETQFRDIPFMNAPNGFWILAASMTALSLGFILFFVHKKWL
jgi:magnesium transporter